MESVELTLRQGQYQIPLEAVGPLRSPSRHLAPKHVPTIPVGQDCSLSLASRGFAWGKNRAIFLPAAPRGARIVRQFLPAAPREARIVPRNLAAVRERQETCRETFPTSGLGQETVFLACRRVVWSKKRVFFLSRRLGETRNVRKFTRVR